MEEKTLQQRKMTYCHPSYSNKELCEVIVVSEQATHSDARMHSLFSGQEGQYIQQCLRVAQIPLSACYFTSVFKDCDLPSSAYIKAPKTKRESPSWLPDGDLYGKLLREELSKINAKLIIAVGNIALQATTGRWGIDSWRGSLLPCLFDSGKTVLPILPAERVFSGESEVRHLIICDLKKAVRARENGFRVTERVVETKPSYEQTISWLDKLYEEGMNGTTIAFDIEVKYQELNCISFSYEPTRAISIPFIYEKGDYWDVNKECAIMLKIARILSSPSIRKLGQNIIFDTHFMLRKYGIRSVNIDDTMLAQHALLPQFPKGLDMICSLWTDIPYYKDEGKEWFKYGGAYQTLWNYNGLDSIVCVESFHKIIDDVIRLDNLLAYERQLSIIGPCTYMMERGICVDMDGLRAERLAMEKEVEFKRAELQRAAPNLNPNSSKQLQEFFYILKGFPIYKNKEGKATCDAMALKRIARQKRDGANVAKLILEIRKQEKIISTYLADVKFDDDGRIRCSYNPAGTTFSRLSSSKSIFGTGMNMQNWPHRSLKHLLPDEGYAYYGIDLSQAENRIVAQVGDIAPMIKAFEENQDVHRLTASLIFRKPAEEITDKPGTCDLGTGEYSERDWGKKANHGLNYGLGYKAFALRYEMPENEAKRICNGYHSAYPGVRKGFHSFVEESLSQSRIVPNLMGRKVLFLSDITSSTKQAAYASIPQGTVGDVINERGMAFLYYNKRYQAVELLQQVHDSIGFQIPLSLPWIEHAAILWDLKESLETPLTTHKGRSFVIPADIVIGKSLHKESGIEFKAKKFPKSVEELAAKLEEAWATLQEK